jgi:phosphonate transport system ATP-binding protein
LSGGERQRVGISRALMQQPDLLLVDEPTASLDPKTSRQVMRLLVELAHERGTPALVNIHDVGLAQSFADRIIGLAEGHIVFDGTAQQVTAQVLTDIYGEEDWSTTILKVEEGDDKDTDKGPPKRKDSMIREAEAG